MEKRFPLSIVVQLAQGRERALSETELTYTENISAHGACVISRRLWNIDDVAQVTALEGVLALHGRVVHCQKRGEDRYAVGLAFRDQLRWQPSAVRKAIPGTELAPSF